MHGDDDQESAQRAAEQELPRRRALRWLIARVRFNSMIGMLLSNNQQMADNAE